MTQPTQAQIEAAVEAVRKAWLQRGVGPKALAEAALTAAARVGEPQHSVDFMEGIAEGTAATIERCAQVAEKIGKYSNGEWIDLNCEAIATAIRRLKDAP